MRFARESACNMASVLPSTPSGLGRWRAACSGWLQRGQVSPTAHRTLRDTAERQEGQRIRARSTIGLTNWLGPTSRSRSLRPEGTHHPKATPDATPESTTTPMCNLAREHRAINPIDRDRRRRSRVRPAGAQLDEPAHVDLTGAGAIVEGEPGATRRARRHRQDLKRPCPRPIVRSPALAKP